MNSNLYIDKLSVNEYGCYSDSYSYNNVTNGRCFDYQLNTYKDQLFPSLPDSSSSYDNFYVSSHIYDGNDYNHQPQWNMGMENPNKLKNTEFHSNFIESEIRCNGQFLFEMN